MTHETKGFNIAFTIIVESIRFYVLAHISLRSILILPFHLRLGLLIRLFISGLPIMLSLLLNNQDKHFYTFKFLDI